MTFFWAERNVKNWRIYSFTRVFSSLHLSSKNIKCTNFFFIFKLTLEFFAYTRCLMSSNIPISSCIRPFNVASPWFIEFTTLSVWLDSFIAMAWHSVNIRITVVFWLWGASFFQEIPNLYLKITAEVWVRLIGEYFPKTSISDHSYR